MGYLCASYLVFLGLSVLGLGQMYATDRRQTDVRRQTASSLNAAPHRGRGIINVKIDSIKFRFVTWTNVILSEATPLLDETLLCPRPLGGTLSNDAV